MSKDTIHLFNNLSIKGLVANGFVGSTGQALLSNGTGVYWGSGAGFTGSKGDKGEDGVFGGAAFDYTYSTNTTLVDPGDGGLKFNNTNLSVATLLVIHDNDDNSVSINNYLQTIDDSTSAIKGHFTITEKANTANFSQFSITGNHVESGNTFQLPVAYLSGATSQTNGLDIIITFARTGDRGDTGYTGSTGFVGSQGDIGFTGSRGATGFTGSQGYTGSQGVIGFTGSKGDIGYTGSQGFTGSASTVAGPTGFTGSQGVGFTGSKGDTGFVGSASTTAGPTGFTGSQGAGFTGSKGDIGYTGSQGTTGFTGSQGVIGFTGSKGDIGFTGSKGDGGPIGFTGSKGDIGFSGSQGFTGSQGTTGFTGSKGDIGFTGSQGPIGYTGSQGPIGYTGSKGDIGFTGSKGDIGYTGSNGSVSKNYTALTGTTGQWFTLFTMSESTNGPVMVNVKTYAHSSATFIAYDGYGPTGINHIVMLGSLYNINGAYANISGARILDGGEVQIQLVWTSGPTVDISMTIYSSGTIPTLSASLTAYVGSGTVHDTVDITDLNGRIRTENGFTALAGDVRAPIFYDSANTSFYIDPASTSNINTLNGNGKEALVTNDSYLRINQTSAFSSGIWTGSSNLLNSSGIFGWGSNGGTTTSRVYINGGTYNGTNVIAIDGTGGTITTRGQFQSNEGVSSSTNDAGLAVFRSSFAGTGQYRHSIVTRHNSAANTNNAWDFYLWRPEVAAGTEATHRAFVIDGAVGTTSTISSRAPIFYDSDNTTYYIDGAGGTRLGTQLEVLGARPLTYTSSGGGLTIQGDSGGWATGTYFLGSSGTNFGGFGALGSANTFSYLWAGTAYNDAALYLYASPGNYAVSPGSLRAPIFYDSDNTGYYLDPNSGGLALRTSGYWIADTTTWAGDINGKIQYHDNSWYFSASNQWVFRASSGAEPFRVTQAGIAIATTDMRAPIFYDNNNTAYYTDPASTSNVNIIQLNGQSTMATQKAWVATNYGHGIYGVYNAARYQHVWSMGVDYNLAADGLSTGLGGNLYGLAWSYNPDYAGAGNNAQSKAGLNHQLLLMMNGTTYFAAGNGVWTSGTGTSTADWRAPIFYDSDNTAYYLDPNSNSRFAGDLNLGNFSNIRFNGTTYGAGVATIEGFSTGFSFYPTGSTNGITFSIYGTYTDIVNSIRSPIYYDRTNTAYYFDGNATSNLLGLTVTNTITGNISGNAGTATSATSATSATYLNSSNYIERGGSSGNLNTDFQNTPAGTMRYHGDVNAGTNAPTAQWWIYESKRHSNASNYWGVQIAWGWEDAANRLRTRNVTNGTFGAWVNYWNDNNDGSGSGLDADLLDGYNTSVSTAGSTVVVRDASGDDFRRYGFADYFNMSHAASGATTDTIFYSSGDNYIRKNNATGFRASLNVPTRTGGDASGTWGISITGSSASSTGNAATATTLQTARTINGVSFNGSANITVADSTKLPTAGGTMTGLLVGLTSASTDVNTANDTGSFSARGNTTTVASMSFHRAGAYAINMGLGTDNVFRIGGWSASSNAFQMDGSGNLTMLNNITAYSDIRLKKDIVKIDNALEKVGKLNGYTYTRTDTNTRQMGVIAQEVMEVIPEVVLGSEETNYSVAYGNMVGLLIEAIKEQQAHINRLEQMVNKLVGDK